MTKQSKITKSARGESCLIRYPIVCNFDPSTTVFCHVNGGGMGMKNPDWQGAYGCSACHDEYDRRTQYLDKQAAELWFHHAVLRTLDKLFEKGLLKIS